MMKHFTQHNVWLGLNDTDPEAASCTGQRRLGHVCKKKKSTAPVPELGNRNINRLVGEKKQPKNKTDLSGLLSASLCLLTAAD